MNDAIILLLSFATISFLYLLLSVLWFVALHSLRSLVRNRFLRTLVTSFFGIAVLFLLFLFINFIISDSTAIITSFYLILGVWLLLSGSYLITQVTSVLLDQNKRLTVIFLHLLVVFTGLTISIIATEGNSESTLLLLFIGLYLFAGSFWFVFMQVFERFVTNQWASYKFNYTRSNLLAAIDFKMTVFTRVLNRFSEIIWRPRFRFFFWVAMIAATFLELFWFMSYGGDIFILMTRYFSYEIGITVFILVSFFMTVGHEWGHLIGAKANSGFGLYKEKLAVFARDAVDIPLLAFTPKQRIMIALMGTLWTNLLSFIPVMVLIASYLLYPELLYTPVGLITSAMSFYAILGTAMFITALWPGGDMNNVLRDLYIILAGKRDLTKPFFSSERELAYSLVVEDFQFDEEKIYRFKGKVAFTSVEEGLYYMLDSESYSAYLVNESAYIITRSISHSGSWKLAEVLSMIRSEFDILPDETPAVIRDVISFFSFLGQRGYIEEADYLDNRSL